MSEPIEPRYSCGTFESKIYNCKVVLTKCDDKVTKLPEVPALITTHKDAEWT